MNRLQAALETSRTDERLCLFGFLPGGYPTRERFALGAAAAFAAGVDALEVSLPNPPLPLDGPLIQEAGRIGARNVPDPGDALALAAGARTTAEQAVVALAYRHAVDALGVDALIEVCVRADTDALLMPQHTFAEQVAIASRARTRGVEQVLFLHLEEDLALLPHLELDRPVIYVQSADLQTGGAFDPEKALERLEEVRAALAGADAYVVIGFGVRGPDEVDSLTASDVDGVVVGTSIVEAAQQGSAELSELVGSIRGSLTKIGAGPRARP